MTLKIMCNCVINDLGRQNKKSDREWQINDLKAAPSVHFLKWIEILLASSW